MRRFLVLPIAGLAALGASAAFAALDNSHHDLIAFSGSTQQCFHCHGRTDTNNVTATLANTGSVGALCLGRCHSGAGILATSATLVPDAPNYPNYTDSVTAADVDPVEIVDTVYWTGSHGNDPLVLVDPYDGATQVDITPTGYPYVTAAEIQCSSCHSVHDNANTPFIWDALGTFCTECHGQTTAGRSTMSGADMTTVAPDGNHPVDFVVNQTDAAGRAAVTRLPRRISLDAAAPGRYWDVASPSGAALNDPAQHYVTGGKLSDFANWDPATTTQQMGCYTCHSAHNTAFSNLVNAPNYNVALGLNPICMGCHGAGATVVDNYGYAFGAGNVGMTNYGHAVNQQTNLPVAAAEATNDADPTTNTYVTSAGGFSLVIADPAGIIPAGFVPGVGEFGPAGEVMCSSCHDVHGGTGKLIPQGFSTPMCNECHSGIGMEDVADLSEAGAGEAANSHHRTNPLAFANGDTGAADADPLVMGNPSWAAGGWGDLGDGLQCADCHIGNQTAHNW